MNAPRLAFILALVAGLLCFSAFFWNYLRKDQLDYTVLFAGLFIVAVGTSSYLYRKQPRK